MITILLALIETEYKVGFSDLFLGSILIDIALILGIIDIVKSMSNHK